MNILFYDHCLGCPSDYVHKFQTGKCRRNAEEAIPDRRSPSQRNSKLCCFCALHWFQALQSTSTLAMYPEETNAFDDAFAYLTFLTSPSAQKTAQPLALTHAEAIMSVLERWPVSQVFPGASCESQNEYHLLIFCPVIDLARLLTGYCPEMLQNRALRERFYNTLLKTAEWFSPWDLPLTKIKETNILLALRTMVNALQEGATTNEPWVGQVRGLEHCANHGTKYTYRYYRPPMCGIPQCQKLNG